MGSNIETFEEAVIMSDSRTVYEHTAPRIAQIAKTGEMQLLLPASSK